MTEKRQFRAIKGTRDILPPDSSLWNWFEQTAREVFESYSFREIRVPIFEETQLFARSIGAETDVVSKEMYTFRGREERLKMAEKMLREKWDFDQKTGLPVDPRHARELNEWKAGEDKPPSGEEDDGDLLTFRRERPQKGRYRQFYQIGAEVLGQSDAPAIDAEVLEMLLVFFRRVGLTRTTLSVNSIGDKE